MTAGKRASGEPFVVEVRPGDGLAAGRAEALARALGAAGETDVDVLSRPLPDGFSWLVARGRAGGQHRVAGFFEGVDATASNEASVRLPADLCGVLCPAPAVAAAFAGRWPRVPVEPRPVSLPPMTPRPPPDRCGELRVLARETLGVPDATRLVVGVGPMDAHSGWERFAALALRTGERRNGVVFVWVGGGGWDPRRRLATGVPMGLRRLFVREDREVGNWLCAADAYLGCRPAGVYDPGALEAGFLGLPVVVLHPDALPAAAAESGQLGVPAPGAEVDVLLGRLFGAAAGSDEARRRRVPGGGLQYRPAGQDWIEVCLSLLAEPDENRRQPEESE